MSPQFLTTPQGRKIAFHQTAGTGVGLVFLGGFSSDMQGSKAVHLEDWAKSQGRPFLRFDYSGHGESSEKFVDGCIGAWATDAIEAISTLTTDKQILIGSSMGGWISLLAARAIPDRIAGLVGIAAAPDFTEDSMWAWMDEAQKAELADAGVVYIPNDYDQPYPITQKLIEDGRNQLVLRSPMTLPFPVRLLHGTADADVSMDVALRLLDHAQGDDIRLNFVKGADHRFSDAACLDLITASVQEITQAIS